MAAGPQYGTVIAMGRSGRIYNKSIYCSDVNGALVNWDSGAGANATSENHYLAPEALVIRDFALAADLTDCKQLQICRNGVPTGDIVRTTIELVSVIFRPAQAIPFNAKDKITIIQKT